MLVCLSTFQPFNLSTAEFSVIIGANHSGAHTMKRTCLTALCVLSLASASCIETAAGATLASASTYIGNKGQKKAYFPHTYFDTFNTVLKYLQGPAEAQLSSAIEKQGYIRAILPEGQVLIFELEATTPNTTHVKLTAKSKLGIHSDDLAKEHFDALSALLK